MSFIFCSTDTLFLPNNPLDVAREYPILLKNLAKGGENWSTQKVVLDW